VSIDFISTINPTVDPDLRIEVFSNMASNFVRYRYSVGISWKIRFHEFCGVSYISATRLSKP
jgi:hypothetical protein